MFKLVHPIIPQHATEKFCSSTTLELRKVSAHVRRYSRVTGADIAAADGQLPQVEWRRVVVDVDGVHAARQTGQVAAIRHQRRVGQPTCKTESLQQSPICCPDVQLE